MTESRRYIIEHHKSQDGCSVSELAQAMQSMPNGWLVKGIENRQDGTTIVHLAAQSKSNVKPIEVKE